MQHTKIYRGFMLLKKVKEKNFTLKLLVQNNQRYIVLLKRYFWGVPVFSKTFTYTEQEVALKMFYKLMQAKVSNSSALSAAA